MFNNFLLKDINIDVPYEVRKYKASSTIFFEGDKMVYVGIIEKGNIIIKTSNIDGYEFEILTIKEGNIFGDMLAIANKDALPGNIISSTDSTIVLFKNTDFIKLIMNNKEFLSRYLKYTAELNIEKTYKIKLLGQASIREKIFFFMKEEIKKTGSNRVILNMTKEELATAMSTNRPSLSRELMRMKADGIIDYDKKSITYLK
ncbi:Crp/Fnr family transcriptional regulator [bacterium]|nr:Crp/Fnr family transcriptional regulator [bacterium]